MCYLYTEYSGLNIEKRFAGLLNLTLNIIIRLNVTVEHRYVDIVLIEQFNV